MAQNPITGQCQEMQVPAVIQTKSYYNRDPDSNLYLQKLLLQGIHREITTQCFIYWIPQCHRHSLVILSVRHLDAKHLRAICHGFRRKKKKNQAELHRHLSCPAPGNFHHLGSLNPLRHSIRFRFTVHNSLSHTKSTTKEKSSPRLLSTADGPFPCNGVHVVKGRNGGSDRESAQLWSNSDPLQLPHAAGGQQLVNTQLLKELIQALVLWILAKTV